MKKLYDLAVKVGEYEKNGDKKSRYKNVGGVFDKGDGMFILLDKTFNPAGVNGDRDTILVSMFEPKQKNNDLDQDIPF